MWGDRGATPGRRRAARRNVSCGKPWAKVAGSWNTRGSLHTTLHMSRIVLGCGREPGDVSPDDGRFVPRRGPGSTRTRPRCARALRRRDERPRALRREPGVATGVVRRRAGPASPGPPSTAAGAARPRRGRDLRAGAGRIRGERGLRRVDDRHGRAGAPAPRNRRATGALSPAAAARATRCGASCSASPAREATSRTSRPRAEREGDEFVVNGQKVWTSNAHLCDFAILLARTNVDVPKHRGISFCSLDLRTPGSRGAAAAPDHRRRALQRGVPHRRARSRSRTSSARSTAAGVRRAPCSRTRRR